MGGKPSKGTSKDQRLKSNNPSAGNASKGKTTPPAPPALPTKPAPKKAGGKS